MARMRPDAVQPIRICFVDGTGATTEVTSLPILKNRRKLNHEGWNRDESIRKFLWYLSRCDVEGFEASADALIRLNCLGDALKSCLKGQRPNKGKLEILLHFWNVRGLWSIPRALKEDLCLFTDAVRYFAPPYVGDGLTLYRGQSRTRHENGIYGIAWTSRYEIAEQQFAGLRDSPGIVVKVDASPDMIVAHVPDYIQTPKTNPASELDFEDEYLLDPRKLVGRVSVVC